MIPICSNKAKRTPRIDIGQAKFLRRVRTNLARMLRKSPIWPWEISELDHISPEYVLLLHRKEINHKVPLKPIYCKSMLYKDNHPWQKNLHLYIYQMFVKPMSRLTLTVLPNKIEVSPRGNWQISHKWCKEFIACLQNLKKLIVYSWLDKQHVQVHQLRLEINRFLW